VTVCRDGKHVYVKSSSRSALAIFSRHWGSIVRGFIPIEK
jgi:hypothetical protein